MNILYSRYSFIYYYHCYLDIISFIVNENIYMLISCLQIYVH